MLCESNRFEVVKISYKEENRFNDKILGALHVLLGNVGAMKTILISSSVTILAIHC